MTIQVTRRGITALALVAAMFSLPHVADPVPLLTGRVILTVSGQISMINKDDNTEFERVRQTKAAPSGGEMG